MNDWIGPLLAGAATGILSGFGAGGGTLLLVYMTAFAGVEQRAARGINLIYFIPAALLALPHHVRNGYIEKEALLPAISTGLACAGLAAWFSTGMDADLLRRCFGVFLIVIGLWETLGRRRTRP